MIAIFSDASTSTAAAVFFVAIILFASAPEHWTCYLAEF